MRPCTDALAENIDLPPWNGLFRAAFLFHVREGSPMATISIWRLVLRGLIYHGRVNLAVLLGVAAGTAVLTGALLVGDSVRSSLRGLTLERLGRIDAVLVADHFFRGELAAELAGQEGFASHFSAAVPAILFPQATVEKSDPARRARARGVTVVGCPETFWQQDVVGMRPDRLPGPGEILLNEPLAEELSARVGDTVVIRLPVASQVPADSPLGRTADRIRSLAELQVVGIVPARGLGRFGLRPSQQSSRNAYLALRTLEEALSLDGRVNAVLIAGTTADAAPPTNAGGLLREMLAPRLSDYGLRWDHVQYSFQPPGADAEQPARQYFQLTSDRMLLPPEVDAAMPSALAGENPQPVLTYLANAIDRARDGMTEPGDEAIWYSTITAVDSVPRLGPLLASDDDTPWRLADDQIVLNSWAAQQLDVQPGDPIRVWYFLPETTHGAAVEQSQRFTLRAVIPVVEPVEPYTRRRDARFAALPTPANDPLLTPVVPGITDQRSIDDWDPPFPFDSQRIRERDERYWDYYRTTPKAFVSLAAGRRLWGSRFGQTTAWRVAAEPGRRAEELAARIERHLQADAPQLGLELLEVKRDGLAAARGTTSFSLLFLGFSLFLIASAIMLVALLFRLGIEQRAAEWGLLLAVGLPRRVVGRLMWREGLLLALAGGLIGTAAGVGYAWLLLVGLRTWWLDAVVTPFLQLAVSPRSLVAGCATGAVVAAVTVAVSGLQLSRVSAQRLIAGQARAESTQGGRTGRGAGWLRAESTQGGRTGRGAGWLAAGLLGAGASLGLAATRWGGEMQAAAFFGCGACVLAALLVLVRWRLRGAGIGADRPRPFGLSGLALRNAARHPGRSTLSIGLIATACFLIVAIGAFRLEPTETGTGGFQLVAETDQPVFADLNSPAGRRSLLGHQAELLAGTSVLALRVREGEDASCRNLYQPGRPRLLGVPPAAIESLARFEPTGFAWAAHAALPEPTSSSPWRLLWEVAGAEAGTRAVGGTANGGSRDAPPVRPAASDVLPVILDRNTALYSLHLNQGIGQEFELEYDAGQRLRFRVVGLLANSILQGQLLVSEAGLLRHFPQVSGYRYFLIRTAPDQQGAVASLLEDRLGDEGFDARETRGVLHDLLAVQNTYLSTFQSLGALGLLLGTLGLATVQLRSVMERRGELALMRAAGFRGRRLALLVILEHAVLLVGGLTAGVLAAALAVLPQYVWGGAQVPWLSLVGMLAAVLAAGLAAGVAAVRAALRAPLLAALREE